MRYETGQISVFSIQWAVVSRGRLEMMAEITPTNKNPTGLRWGF